MARKKTPAEIREFIRAIVFEITGQRLTSQRIKLLKNPRANSRIVFYPSTKKIFALAIGTTYWKGPEGPLRAVTVHEVMNLYASQDFSPEEINFLEQLRKAKDSRQRIAILTQFEITEQGWRNILARKLEVDRLAMKWLCGHSYSLLDYIQFLIEEWNESNIYQQPRRRFHRLISAKRVREAALFIEEHCRQTINH